MLNKSQLEAYAKELEVRQRAAKNNLEQAKADFNAINGAKQAVAELIAMLLKNEKEASCSNQSAVSDDKASK